MKPKFELSINSVQVVNELPGSWSDKDFLALLEQLEFEDVSSISADQPREYAVMALQDLEVAEAAKALLDVLFGDTLSDGKKQNLSEEMGTDRCWEEYPDLGCHERIFNAQFLLHQAFPETPQSEIHKVEGELSCLNQSAEAYLQKHRSESTAQPIPESLLVRCMASVLPDNAILNRLFEDQIQGVVPFAEAGHILWHSFHQALPAEGDRRVRYQLSLLANRTMRSSFEPERIGALGSP